MIPESKEEKSISEWQGFADDTMVKELKVTEKRKNYNHFTRYDDGYTYTLEDADKNIYKYVTLKSLEVNSTNTYKFIIKDHIENKGAKQTVITRLSIVK